MRATAHTRQAEAWFYLSRF